MIRGRRPRWIVRVLLAVLPVRAGMQLVQWLAVLYVRVPWLARRHRRALALTQEFAGRPVDERAQLHRRLLANTPHAVLYTWRRLAIGRPQGRRARDWVEFHGLDRLEAARNAERGLILLSSHFGGGSLVPPILAGWLGLEFTSLHGRDGYGFVGIAPPQGFEAVELRNSFLPRVLLDCMRKLQRGETVHLAADGYIGKSGRELEFCGRRRFFNQGFPEMAEASGAVILPVFAPFREDGRLRIEFLEPLNPGPGGLDRAERAMRLLDAYVRILEHRWASDPGNILAGHLNRFSRLEPAVPERQPVGSSR